MNGQWGRNTPVAQGGSSAGFFLAALLCLILIGAGVYGWYVREGLQTEIATLAKRNADLADTLARSESDRTKLSEDIKALKHNAGQWAGELEQDYANLQLNEVPKLNRLLDKRDATISDLEKQLDALKAEGKINAGETARLEAELQNALSEAGRNTEVISDLRHEIDRLANEADQLRAEGDDRGNAQARAQSLLLAEQTKAKATESELAKLQKRRIPELEAALSAEKSKTANLERRLAALEKDLMQKPLQSESPDDGVAPAGTGRVPRDVTAVAALLEEQPGLSRLDNGKFRQLRDELASGACVTDALEGVFDKVPLIVMRNLMRELKSDC